MAELSKADTRMLADTIGPTMGPWYRRLGRGADSSPVDATPYVPRGHGRERTFQENIADWAVVETEVRRLSGEVVQDILKEGRPAVRVGLKIRYAPFETRSRSLTLPGPTYDERVIADAAVTLLARVEPDRPVRLLGVRAEMLDPPDPPDPPLDPPAPPAPPR